MDLRYRLNEPDVSHESFEDEILVINLKNGNYYSLLGTAIPAWLLLAKGVSVDEVSQALSRSSQADLALVSAAVSSFVNELEKENLLVLVPNAAPPANLPAVPLPKAFSPPRFDRYTDMQQLLLMDPIHEVDDTGWPMARNPNQNQNGQGAD
jgi:hypothetical protein